MCKATEKKKQLSELHKSIWAIACDFWGKMEADDYKNYVLSLLFYRYLSERTENYIKDAFEHDVQATYAERFEEHGDDLREDTVRDLGFLIKPEYLFNHMYDMINVQKDGFDVEYLNKAINSLTESTLGHTSQDTFDNIFEDMDLSSSKLGKSVEARSKLIAKAITNIGGIDFGFADDLGDIMGDAYEYMIGQFAAGAGKKSGSFYTPAQVGELMARLTTIDKPDPINAFDACGGSGSLLLTLKKHTNITNLYYQELTTSTYNLARMNMLLHGVPYDNIHMFNDDALENPAFTEVEHDIIVANPPYSQNWSADPKFLEDERFSKFGVLPTKSKADFAFVMSMFHNLKSDGVMAVVLPHGVLFRGSKEAQIRQKLIEGNHLDAVIGLPSDIFFGTGIPTCILILKKERTEKDVLFIDASKGFMSGSNQNFIRDEDIDKIVKTYTDRVAVEKYAEPVEFDTIKENDFNLNIPLYVDTFEDEVQIDLGEMGQTLRDTHARIAKIDDDLFGFYKELGIEKVIV